MEEFQIEIKNLLNEEECQKIIEWFDNYEGKKHAKLSNDKFYSKYGFPEDVEKDTSIYESDYIIIFDIEEIESEYVKSIFHKIVQDNSHKNVVFDWGTVVSTYPGTSTSLHQDRSVKDWENENITQRVWSTITYLNENYEGGEYVVPGLLEYKPSRGSCLKMYGSEHVHGVNSFSGNTKRYIINAWFVENEK